VEFERQTTAAAFISKGPPIAQSVFKMAVCQAYARHVDIRDAVDLAVATAKEVDPLYEPVYDAALLDLM
jgi:hypothetical protein